MRRRRQGAGRHARSRPARRAPRGPSWARRSAPGRPRRPTLRSIGHESRGCTSLALRWRRRRTDLPCEREAIADRVEDERKLDEAGTSAGNSAHRPVAPRCAALNPNRGDEDFRIADPPARPDFAKAMTQTREAGDHETASALGGSGRITWEGLVENPAGTHGPSGCRIEFAEQQGAGGLMEGDAGPLALRIAGDARRGIGGQSSISRGPGFKLPGGQKKGSLHQAVVGVAPDDHELRFSAWRLAAQAGIVAARTSLGDRYGFGSALAIGALGAREEAPASSVHRSAKRSEAGSARTRIAAASIGARAPRDELLGAESGRRHKPRADQQRAEPDRRRSSDPAHSPRFSRP